MTSRTTNLDWLRIGSLIGAIVLATVSFEIADDSTGRAFAVVVLVIVGILTLLGPPYKHETGIASSAPFSMGPKDFAEIAHQASLPDSDPNKRD